MLRGINTKTLYYKFRIHTIDKKKYSIRFSSHTGELMINYEVIYEIKLVSTLEKRKIIRYIMIMSVLGRL